MEAPRNIFYSKFLNALLFLSIPPSPLFDWAEIAGRTYGTAFNHKHNCFHITFVFYSHSWAVYSHRWAFFFAAVFVFIFLLLAIRFDSIICKYSLSLRTHNVARTSDATHVEWRSMHFFVYAVSVCMCLSILYSKTSLHCALLCWVAVLVICKQNNVDSTSKSFVIASCRFNAVVVVVVIFAASFGQGNLFRIETRDCWLYFFLFFVVVSDRSGSHIHHKLRLKIHMRAQQHTQAQIDAYTFEFVRNEMDGEKKKSPQNDDDDDVQYWYNGFLLHFDRSGLRFSQLVISRCSMFSVR